MHSQVFQLIHRKGNFWHFQDTKCNENLPPHVPQAVLELTFGIFEYFLYNEYDVRNIKKFMSEWFHKNGVSDDILEKIDCDIKLNEKSCL